jgi:hypothetical protein
MYGGDLESFAEVDFFWMLFFFLWCRIQVSSFHGVKCNVI